MIMFTSGRPAHPGILTGILWALVALMTTGSAMAYNPKHAPAPGTDRTTTQPADDDEKPWPERYYQNLRYDEDWSYLDDYPEAKEEDWRLRLKNIDLGDLWRMDVGGEFRFRMETRRHQMFGLEGGGQHTQQNYRYFLHTNVKYDDVFRLFLQGAFTHAERRAPGGFQMMNENHGDFQQFFVDVTPFGRDFPLTARIGRQELSYGSDRLVGPLEWVSNRRRFDAAKLFYHSEHWDIDVFFARPTEVRRHKVDRWDDKRNFWGVYNVFKLIPDHGIDFYVFGLHNSEPMENPNGNIGGQDIYTMGTRLWGYWKGFHYDMELAGQFGRWAEDRVNAWLWEVDFGYTFHDLPWTPRLGAGFSYSTGDRDPKDGQVNTFNQLFPFDHVCIGIHDLIGRQNLTRASVSLEVWPFTDKLHVGLYYHAYWLTHGRDAYYNAMGMPVLRDDTGRSGVELGDEVDLWLSYSLSPNSMISFGYAHFFRGNFVNRAVKDGKTPNLFILQYAYRF